MIVYLMSRPDRVDLFAKAAAGIGDAKTVFTDSTSKAPASISPDGRWLAFTSADSFGGKTDIWLLDRQSGSAKPFLTSPFSESTLQFSPDGNWVTYVSDESGRDEVYVLQFPESSGKWIVSREGGNQPEWSADGAQIYYLAKDRTMMSVGVTLGATVQSQSPVALFPTRVRTGYPNRNYCVSRDGSRFLLNREVVDTTARSITFVQNWTNASKQ